mgnify:CR=1 FL=1
MFSAITSCINNNIKIYKRIYIISLINIMLEKSLLQSKKILCLMFIFVISTLLISVVTAITFVFNTAKYMIL